MLDYIESICFFAAIIFFAGAAMTAGRWLIQWAALWMAERRTWERK